MALVNVPVRHLSRRQLIAADVELNYNTLAKAVGANPWYSGGVSQGSINGSLDYRNFQPDAGIPNAYKTAPYSIFCVPLITVSAPVGAVTMITPVFGGQQQAPTSLTNNVSSASSTLFLTGFTMTYTYASSATNSGTAQFAYIDQTGTANNIGTLVSWTNTGLSPAILTNQTLTVPFQYNWKLQVTITNNISMWYVCQVWFKTLHTK